MEKKLRTVYMPNYLLNFHCIGSECSDTCCAGWRVDIDKKTYKKYNNVHNTEFKKLFKANIKRNKTTASDVKYALIKLKEDSSCPFLSDDKLCRVQMNFGSEYLSNTCAIYPRITNIIDGTMERAATMSCPEIARAALLNEEPMTLVKSAESEDTHYSLNHIFNTAIPENEGKYQKYFKEIRAFSIWLLQNRQYRLWQRMLLLGVIFEAMNKSVIEGNTDNILSIMDHYKEILSSEKKLDINFKVDHLEQIGLQIQILKQLIDQRVKNGVSDKRYYDCFSEFLAGIGYVKDAKMDDISIKYEEAYNKYFEPYIKEHEYILENYIVNYIYKNASPCSGKQSLFDEYIMLNIHYSMIKMHLIGLAGEHKEDFNTELVLKLIQSFAKTVEHNSDYLNSILEYLHKSNNAHMTCMAMMIVN